ncbi:hypothetical protein HYPSUDRAFT_45294 [Hypholoma sublateritium FD-334 SS-4]|uniref:WW domain-containing protein n=1 Tax=Hypholoma sublateritium (strain FD-334 SS-4) TaxID=945553 RepID=A0A0D2NHJ4_HYPSF|nr:hypothetical protein HYPSUDRAFT_45294 [Hypholoma sublateritium FD-334 SS-4]
MGSALSPLRALLIALRRLVSCIANPKFIRAALTGLVRRLALWAAFLRSKLFHKRRIDKPPDKSIVSSNDDSKTAVRDVPAYTIVRSGEIVSLSGTALSLYPYSSNGIRNSRAPARSGHPQTRNSSRNRESDTNSFAGSTWELALNPIGPPSRPHSRLRTPRRQFSTSLPDINDSVRHRTDNDNLSWLPHRSPPPGIGIELASPTLEGHPPWSSNDSEVHIQFPLETGNPIPSEQLTYSSPCHSPPPDIQVEVTSPIEVEVASPANLSQTSLEVPNEISDKMTPRPISPAASDSQGSRSGVVLDVIPLGPPLLQNSEIEVHIIKAILPEDTRRYARRTKIAHRWCSYQLEPMTTVFDTSSTPPGWLRLVHPEGARYFYHEDKNVYTDSDLTDFRVYERLMNDVFRLERLISTFDKPLPKGASLMIDVSYEDDNKGSLQTEYYYADHDERIIFFVHPSNTDDMPCTFEVNGPKSYQHLGFVMQSQYWMFVSLYPRCLMLTDELLCELRDIVLFLIGDHMTSPYSTAPYTMADLFQILSLIDGMEKNVGKRTAGTMSLFARHMHIFYHSKYLNCYGETFSRIERHFSIFGDPIDKRTWLVKTLSFVLFSAPDVHLRNLQKMWVDGMLHKSVWEDSTKKLNEEWQEFIFFATVMLTSNVGYLAIQSVDIDMGAARSPGQIASYLSVVANIGSIILGLLLMRQNRTKRTETADEVQKFLTQKNHPLLGLETLAILYSLPYALLMWGVVSFLVAFCCLFFQNSTAESRAWVGSLSVAVAVLIVWCIVTSWESQGEEDAPDRPLVQVESQVEDDNEEDDEKRSRQGIREILDIIRHIPDLVYRRGSVDSEKTAV